LHNQKQLFAEDNYAMKQFVKGSRLALVLICLIFLGACGKDSPEKIAKKDREKIIKYLEENDIQATEHESGLFYAIENPGSGDSPSLTSYLNITYSGYFLNGKVFDGGYEQRMYLQSTILGWQIGVPLFKKGGKGKLFIPSGMGYGEALYNYRIPAHSVLIFDIELIDFY
jgi:FKBP-type peptidyl-prolyl cis-trans isomerase FkpA